MRENERNVKLGDSGNSGEQAMNPDPLMSRSDLLKLAGASGLGMAALLGMAGNPAAAESKDGKKGKFLIVITSGSNDPNRAMLALLLADVIQKQDMGRVHIYLALEGSELCRVGHPEKIFSSNFHKLGNALGVMERLAKNGAQIGVCPPCADWAGAVDDKKYPWAQREDGIVLLRSMMESSWTMWL